MLIYAAIIAGMVAVVLPPLMRQCSRWLSSSKQRLCWRHRVVCRYQDTSTYAWLFAYWKLRLDPMFGELRAHLEKGGNIRNALDIGCGYGIPACSLLEWIPEVTVFGMDPMASRVKVASHAFGARGRAIQRSAPEIDIPDYPGTYDVILAIDMIHYLSDNQLDQMLKTVCEKLSMGGWLIIRAVIPPRGPGSLSWKISKIWPKSRGTCFFYRSSDSILKKLSTLGLDVGGIQVSGGNPEMVWFTAKSCLGTAS